MRGNEEENPSSATLCFSNKNSSQMVHSVDEGTPFLTGKSKDM